MRESITPALLMVRQRITKNYLRKLNSSGTLTVVISGAGVINGTNIVADGNIVADDVMVTIDDNRLGSSGGISTFESQPAYQNNRVNGISSTQRVTPDVAWLASPIADVSIYDSNNYDKNGVQTPLVDFFGTSLAAPMWAVSRQPHRSGFVLNGKGTLSTSDMTNGLQARLYRVLAAISTTLFQASMASMWDLVTT